MGTSEWGLVLEMVHTFWMLGNDMGCVLLSNLYCASGQWKEAEIVRKAMVDQGVKKMPGYSWIEVKNRVTVFVAGDISHPYTDGLVTLSNFKNSYGYNSNFKIDYFLLYPFEKNEH